MLWWTLRQLRSDDAIKRVEAIQKLAGSRDPRVIEALVRSLNDQAESVEKEARKALADMGRAAASRLRAALKSSSARIRINAAALLREMQPDGTEGKSDLLPVLLTAIGESDGRLRLMAAEELGAIGDPAALKSLAVALCDKETDVRRAAREALQKMTVAGETAPATTAASQAPPPASAPLDAIPALVRALRLHRPYEGEHQVAGQWLAQLGEAAVEPLLEMLRSESGETTKAAIIDALAFVPDQRALGPLIEMLAARAPALRLVAARTLGRLRSPEAAVPLKQALNDNDMNVRLEAAEALSYLGASGETVRTVPFLLEVLRSKPANMRQRAASILGRVADPRSAPELARALNDEDQEVRKVAEDALAKLRSGAEEPVIRALKAKSPAVRRAAARILGKIGSSHVIDPLIEAMNDADSSLRAEAASALRLAGDQRALTPLIAALADPNAPVRKNAATALATLGDERIVKPLLASMARGGSAGEILSALIMVMSLYAPDVDAEDLHTMANLAVKAPSDPAAAGQPAGISPETEMDCSALRQLAREELARRGISLHTM